MPSSNPSKPDPAARVQPTAASSPDDAVVDPDDTDPTSRKGSMT
jgi:hypothetical protein